MRGDGRGRGPNGERRGLGEDSEIDRRMRREKTKDTK